MVMKLSQEQLVVDNVADHINGGELLLGGADMEFKAGILMVARHAYRAGRAADNTEGQEEIFNLARKSFSPNDSPRNAFNRNDVFERAIADVLGNSLYVKLVSEAFDKGRITDDQ